MTIDEYFTELLKRMGFEPTPWRLEVFKFWAHQEGMPFERTWNPLATTRQGELDASYNTGFGPGNWNSVPVRVYANPQAGIQATLETIQLEYYINIRKCLNEQKGLAAAVKPRDFVSWVGSEEYGQRVVDFMNSCTASKSESVAPPPVHSETAAGLAARVLNLERLLGGQANVARQTSPEVGNDLWAGFAALQQTVAALATTVAALRSGAQPGPLAQPALVAPALGGAASLEQPIETPAPKRPRRRSPVA